MGALLLAGIGGFIGSVLRFLLSSFVQQLSNSIEFPYGTLAVNLGGCFVIGFLSELAETRGLFTPESRTLVFIGILGGFTTFSTFSNETLNLLRDGQTITALLNTGVQVAFGLGMVWLGRVVAQAIWR